MPDRNLILSSRLAAQTGIRQVNAVVKADQAARGVDREIASLWAELMAILRDDRGFRSNYARALAILRRIRPTVRRAIEARLRKLAAWSHKSSARLLTQTLPVAYLRAAAPVPAEAVREADEPAEPAPSEDELRRLYAELIFPPPDRATIDRILFAPSGGRTWQDRVASLTRLAQPEQLASILAQGMAAGKTQREIANDLLPAVNGVRSSARRIARTESLRVAHQIQMEAHEQLGDLKIGYQIHAQLDANTRPWHASRSGTIYYDEPKPGQKGPAQRPNPPEEALDPSERPAGTPQLAHHCRCWLSPVLAPPEDIVNDPAKMAVFQNNAGDIVPDPVTYDRWFDAADERRRMVAVGAKRYRLLQRQLDRDPNWPDFLDPATGTLVPLDRLKAESPAERAERTAKARALIAERARLIRQTSTFGFLPVQ